MPSIIQELGVSRATLYRDLDFLRRVGVPIASEVVNGEARYRVLGDGRPALVPPLRRVALDVACAALAAFKGTRLLAEVERLRRELPELRRRASVGVRAAQAPVDAVVLQTIERAVEASHVLSLVYRGARDAVSRGRRVAPLELWLVKGRLYLAAHDLDADATRTFKVARVSRATSGEPFDRSAYPRPAPEGSVVVWTGRLLEVAVRLSPAVARFAAEYPLLEGQRVDLDADGAATVRARVAGTEEVLRWVLGWGADAEVLAPEVLRRRVADELARASARYGEAARQGVSREVRRAERRVRIDGADPAVGLRAAERVDGITYMTSHGVRQVSASKTQVTRRSGHHE